MTLSANCKYGEVKQWTSYVAASIDAQQRIKNGEHQYQCPHCKRWYWAEAFTDMAGTVTEQQYKAEVRRLKRELKR